MGPQLTINNGGPELINSQLRFQVRGHFNFEDPGYFFLCMYLRHIDYIISFNGPANKPFQV